MVINCLVGDASEKNVPGSSRGRSARKKEENKAVMKGWLPYLLVNTFTRKLNLTDHEQY